ncbi:MAG: DUF4384 domain-containing protein [Pseudomonadota bacterium]
MAAAAQAQTQGPAAGDDATPAAIQPPPDLAGPALAVFERHCVSCHDGERLAVPRAGGGLANITDLEAIAASPLVTPGDPDRSRLFEVLHARHAPLSLFRPLSETRGPRAKEIDAVRAWIANLAPAPRDRCSDGRARIAERAGWEAARDRLALFAAETARNTRFLSLVHLWNACLPIAEISGLARALPEVLAALTWRPDRAQIAAVPLARGDAEDVTRPELLFSFDLRAFGWRPEDWERLTKPLRLSSRLLQVKVRETAQTREPIIAADAFAKRAFAWEPYARMLRLPKSLAQLAVLAGVDLDSPDVPRVATEVETSAVTGGRRLLSWYRGRAAALWIAEQAGDPHARVLFRLPNGQPAVAVLPKADGDAQPSIKGGAAGCLSCHARGPRQVRQAPPAQPKTGDAEPAAGPHDEFNALAAGDTRNVPLIGKLDPVTALIRVYEAAVDVKRAAAEYGVTPSAFVGILSERIAGGDLAARRLSVGRISRAAFNGLKRRLAGNAPPTAPARQSRGLRKGNDLPVITVWSGRETYASGEPLTFKLHTTATCFPTLITVGANGRAVVVYPNDFDPPKPLGAGKTLTVPAPDASYRFKARELGEERVLAFCAETPAAILAMQPDYQRQVFTLLGNWDAYLTSASETWDEMRPVTRPPPKRRRRARRRRQPRLDPPEPPRTLSRATFRYRVVAPRP